MQPSIGILGAGRWGQALASALSRNHVPLSLWSPPSRAFTALQANNPLPMTIAQSPEAFFACPDILLCLPSNAFNLVLELLAQHPHPKRRLISAAKGFSDDGELFSQALAARGLNIPYAILSGPSFSNEVRAQQPTALSLASNNLELAKDWQSYLHQSHCRVYLQDDVIGVELGGACKNVLAIAAGLIEGQGLGSNARAALITRGLLEMIRLGEAMGAQKDTFYGLSGLGDLILTATDHTSRNYHFGYTLGQGNSITQALKHSQGVVEGLRTCAHVQRLIQQYQIETPIFTEVAAILLEEKPIAQALVALLERKAKVE